MGVDQAREGPAALEVDDSVVVGPASAITSASCADREERGRP